MNWEEAVRSLIENPDRRELVEACFYDSPVQSAAERFFRSEEWIAVSQLLPEPGTVLDIGAGRGISSYAFSRMGWKAIALEPDPSPLVGGGAIEELNQVLSNPIEVVQDWGESLPFENERFDLVYGRAVFHHARNLKEFCSEAYRVVKPGGMILLTREHVLSRPEDLPVFLERHPLHHLYGGECAYTLEKYTAALESAGFEIQEVLSPRKSAVNYHPVTEEALRRSAKQRLIGQYGKLPGWFISLLPGGYRRELARWDREDCLPGRLYSFIGRK